MDKKLEAVLELGRDPMLAVEQGKIVYANTAARMILPELAPEKRGSERLPDSLLYDTTEHFIASLTVARRPYTVSGAYYGETRILSFAGAGGGDKPELMSDGMMVDILSTLLNLKLSIERVTKLTEAVEIPALDRNLAMLRRSGYILRRQLESLNTAIQLKEDVLYCAPRQVNLVALCADLTETVDSLTRKDWAPLEFSSALPELIAWVDPTLTERLLLNLIANSLRHTPREGKIQLRLAQSGDNAVLSIDDDGEGIPPEVLQSVFARYETRLDAAHLDRAATAGLGLFIASGIAKKHGGTMIIESRPGQGTSARVMLPLGSASILPLESGGIPEASGMDGILTELSGLLGYEFYSTKYLD